MLFMAALGLRCCTYSLVKPPALNLSQRRGLLQLQ